MKDYKIIDYDKIDIYWIYQLKILKSYICYIKSRIDANYGWRPSSLSELTPMLFNMGLTHLGSEASNYYSS